jgi:hypothetical protein
MISNPAVARKRRNTYEDLGCDCGKYKCVVSSVLVFGCRAAMEAPLKIMAICLDLRALSSNVSSRPSKKIAAARYDV